MKGALKSFENFLLSLLTCISIKQTPASQSLTKKFCNIDPAGDGMKPRTQKLVTWPLVIEPRASHSIFNVCVQNKNKYKKARQRFGQQKHIKINIFQLVFVFIAISNAFRVGNIEKYFLKFSKGFHLINYGRPEFFILRKYSCLCAVNSGK